VVVRLNHVREDTVPTTQIEITMPDNPTQKKWEPSLETILAIRMVLARDKTVQLAARDIALLAMLRHHQLSRNDSSSSLAEPEVRKITTRYVEILSEDPELAKAGLAEAAAMKALVNLVENACLAKSVSELEGRVVSSYSLTPIGKALADDRLR
jgi:hypothetical protein